MTDLDKLRAFAQDVMQSWPLGDGGDLQDFAVKHGLLTPVELHQPCSEEGCNCAEYFSDEEWKDGITCYRKTKLLKGEL